MRHAIDRFEWDEWMHQSMTFYAPELTPFLHRWKDRGVGFVGSRYPNPADNVTIYSALVSMPHAGHVIEVVSDKVHASLQGEFHTLGSTTCPGAFAVDRTADEMKSMWHQVSQRSERFGYQNGVAHEDFRVWTTVHFGDQNGMAREELSCLNHH